MEGLKHTPGPWALDNENRIIELNGKGIKQIKIISPWREDAWEDDKEAIANMKLMAAAPDLLEAAQYAIECLNNLSAQLGNIGDFGDQALQSLEYSVKKATK